MYQLFSERFLSSNSVVRPAAFEMIKRTYQREVFKINNYYKGSVFYVHNTHILVRLLNTFSIPVSYELDRFIEIAFTRSPYIARQFKFTSSTNFGQIHDGPFYGEGNSEVIISSDEYFNPYAALDNWRSIQAVKVLDHSISDLGLLLPNGHSLSTDKGFAAIEVNIPLLLLQFRGFLLDQQIKLLFGSDSMLAVNHFVYMYVLPGMLFSHIDLVLLNRLINLYTNTPMGKALKKHPFMVVDYENQTDRVLRDVLKHITNNAMLYYSTLKNIPTVFAEDMQERLLMPDEAKTRQLWWALVLSRLKVMAFLTKVGGDRGLRNNAVFVNKLKINLKMLKSDHIYQSQLSSSMYDAVITVIDDILKL